MSGAHITVRDSLMDLVGERTPESDGGYAFGDLEPGTYLVREEDPPGFGSTTPNTVFTVVWSAQISEVVFGDYRLPTRTPTPAPVVPRSYLPLLAVR